MLDYIQLTMNKFTHVILTQFNLKGYDKSHSGLNLDWLASRFQLFDQFCYPSMRGQSNQNFKWIVYFDSDTPKEFKDKISEYEKWKNFIPVYLSTPLTAHFNKKTILKYVSKDHSYLISTLLDNDDGLCIDFIQQVQDNFKSQDLEFISFNTGHVLHINGKLYLFRYLNNPFISLIEKIKVRNPEGFITASCAPHTELSKMGPMKSINSSFSWLQVVHSKNLSNKIRGIRISKKNINDHFSIDIESILKDESFIPFTLDRVYSMIKSILRSFILLIMRRY